MRKLSLSLIFVVVLGVISLGWGISRYYTNYTDQQFDQSDPTFQAYEQLGKTLALTLKNDNYQTDFLNVWGENTALDLSLVSNDELALPDELIKRLMHGDNITLESTNHLSFYFLTKNADHILVLDVKKPPVNDENVLRLILTLAFYLGIIAIISLWLYPLIRRLNKLRKTAAEFGAGDLSARIGASRYSYISDIEGEFNRMADRIHSLVEDNKLLSRAVSHDLKTPIARLRFGFETLEEAQSDEQRKKYHSRIETDLVEMEDLVETLLHYTRMDEAHIALQNVPVDLNLLLTEILGKFPAHTNLTVTSTGNCSFSGDEKYLRMLINNLLTNAAEYCDSQVGVYLSYDTNEITLTIEDDGIGIPEEKRDIIIKPFVKGETLKSSKKKGHGMGLAIVYRVAQWHNARLIIDDSPKLGGARFRIFFPINN